MPSVDAARFAELSGRLAAAEDYHAQVHDQFDLARKWLEAAASNMHQRRGELRAYVEECAGARIA